MRQLSPSRSMRVYGATETKRVYASGWSPTSPAMRLSPYMRAARSLAIAASVGSPRSATSEAASAVVAAAIASRPRHCREQPAALVERGRMRAHDADLLERDILRPYEAVADRQHGLARDRERRLVEEVVRLVDGAGERALDRKDAEGDFALRRRLHHRREAGQGNELGAGRKEVVAGRRAVRAVTAWIGDVHFHG